MDVLLYKEGSFWKVPIEASNVLYLWGRGTGGLDAKETSFSLYTSNFFAIRHTFPMQNGIFFKLETMKNLTGMQLNESAIATASTCISICTYPGFQG